MNMYHEIVMDHYHNPRNHGSLQNPHFAMKTINPSCGDIVSLEGHITDNILTNVRFSGSGCIISQATSSLLTQACIGKDLSTILALTGNDIQNFLETKLGPLRLKCALLSLQALQEGITRYKQKDNGA